jgi:hypothetical protein
VIDNFSRRILAWKVSGTFDPTITAELLLTASKHVVDGKPKLLADGGVENFNKAVDELVQGGVLKRVLAKTDITFSNSMIESWWRVLKHLWPFLNTLDTVGAIENLAAFDGRIASVAGDATEERRTQTRIDNCPRQRPIGITCMRSGKRLCDNIGENSRRRVQNVVTSSTAQC